MFDKINNWYHNLPDNKKWIDLVTAVLTIPVLVTVIASNLGYIKKDEKPEVSAQNLQPTIERIIIKEEGSSTPLLKEAEADEKEVAVQSPAVSCDVNLPEFEIIAPNENEKISADPVCLTIRQKTLGNYCSVLWAYKTNNGSWSTFTNEPICLYNSAQGDIKIEIKIKSHNGTETTLSRNFIIEKNSPSPTVMSTLTPVPSP